MALIWVAIFLFLLVAMIGIAVDTAFVVFVAHQLQNTADGSALAAAQRVRVDVGQARQLAVDIALANVVANNALPLATNASNDPSGDIVVGRFDRGTQVFTATDQAVNAVKVVARRTVDSLGGSLPLLFGPAFGVNTVDVSRWAVAMVGGGTGQGLIALNETERCALDVYGTVELTVNDGAIHVNSGSSQGICLQGNAGIYTESINVQGGMKTIGQPTYTGYLNEGADVVPDPLASLEAPTWDAANDLGTVSLTGGEVVNLVPGFYSGGIAANNGIVTLDPGIYILDGEGLDISGNTEFTALGVMFYITGSGRLNLHGTGDIVITPPDPELYSYPGVDTYEFVSIFQDRDNTNEAIVIGTSLLDLTGTLYFPGNHLSVSGTGDGFGNQLIADTIEVSGTGIVTIQYEGNEAAAGFKVFLVQ